MWYAKLFTLQRLVVVANLVLIAIGAYLGVGIFYQMVGVQMTAPPQAIEAPQASVDQMSMAPRPLTYYQAIGTRDLFKTRNAVPDKGPAQTVDLGALEQTQLQLKLWGTVSGDLQQPYAVIEDLQKREQNLYKVGDSIQDATVKMILREKVVLSVAGKDEVLAMEELTQGSSPRGALSSRGIRPRPFPARPPRQQRISLRRNMIDESLQNVNKLMTEIAIRPAAEGLALSNIKPNSVFRRMGLRNGDILVGVNGQEIRSVEDAMRLYDGLKSSSEVQLQLKRRGQDRTISYNIR